MNPNIKAKLNRNGNIKLGTAIATFSKLYSDMEFVTDYGTVKGSCETRFCDGCRNSCYVPKSYRYPSVVKCHARNTLALREDLKKAFEDLRLQIARARKPFEIIRIHQSGELESTAEFLEWCHLAKNYPHVTFYIYTKAFEYITLPLLMGKVPNNLKVNISVWHEYGITEFKRLAHLPNVKAFVYCDGFNYAEHGLEVETMCMAYDEHGKMNHEITCERCKKCFDDIHKIIGCYDH